VSRAARRKVRATKGTSQTRYCGEKTFEHAIAIAIAAVQRAIKASVERLTIAERHQSASSATAPAMPITNPRCAA